jgi:uncharacterized membrane protein YhaH (DUF805 family)
MTCPKCLKTVEGNPLQCPFCGKILHKEGIKMIQREYEYIEKKGFNAYKFMWKNILEFLGRTTRKEFFHAILIHALIVLLLYFALQPIILLINLPFLTRTFMFFKNVFIFASAIPVYNLLLRRIRDAGLNPIFGFSILIFLFNIAFMSIIINNLHSANESIADILRNPLPFFPFIVSNAMMMPHSEMVMGFLKFVTALNVLLLEINLILVFVASFFKSKDIKNHNKKSLHTSSQKR